MIALCLAAGIICCLIFPLFRLILFNLHNIGIYSVYDLINYFKFKKWEEFNLYGIDMFIGMFGKGKTLSMTHRVRLLYKKYGGNIRIISNYRLNDIPYIPLINFNQIVELGDNPSDKFVGTIVLIDEIENVLSHRNYANFPLALMHSLTQQRKLHIYIMCSAQRFFMVDKLWRSITTNVYDCNKIWRFQNCKVYDAWDLENSMNPSMIKRLANLWWFVKDSDFLAYDTSQMISKNAAEDFISNDELLARKGLDSVANNEAVLHPSKKVKKLNKQRIKR